MLGVAVEQDVADHARAPGVGTHRVGDVDLGDVQTRVGLERRVHRAHRLRAVDTAVLLRVVPLVVPVGDTDAGVALGARAVEDPGGVTDTPGVDPGVRQALDHVVVLGGHLVRTVTLDRRRPGDSHEDTVGRRVVEDVVLGLLVPFLTLRVVTAVPLRQIAHTEDAAQLDDRDDLDVPLLGDEVESRQVVLGVGTTDEVHGAVGCDVTVLTRLVLLVEPLREDQVGVLEVGDTAVLERVRHHRRVVDGIRQDVVDLRHGGAVEQRRRAGVLLRVDVVDRQCLGAFVIAGLDPRLEREDSGGDCREKHRDTGLDLARARTEPRVEVAAVADDPGPDGLAALLQRLLDVPVRQPGQHQGDHDDADADDQPATVAEGGGDAAEPTGVGDRAGGEVEGRQRQQRPVPQVEAVGHPAQALEQAGRQQGRDADQADLTVLVALDRVAGEDDQRRTGERDERQRAGELRRTVEEQAGADDQRQADQSGRPAHPPGHRTTQQVEPEDATETDLPEPAQRRVVVQPLVGAVQVDRVDEGRQGGDHDQRPRDTAAGGLAEDQTDRTDDESDDQQ